LAKGHTRAVKTVTFLPQLDEASPSYFVSGADDHSLRLWTIGRDDEPYCVQALEEHQAAINCIAARTVERENGRSSVVVASGAADATIRIWAFEAGKLVLHQVLKPNPKLIPLAVALHPLGSDGVALAVSGTKETVQIFVAESTEATPTFQLQAILLGHQGWIRSLDFSAETSSPDSDVILASASQDKYIRLWRFHRGIGLPSVAASSGSTLGAFLLGTSPSNKAHRLQLGQQAFSVTFEALLLGHEDWVYSARWHRSADDNLRLLSSSADNSLAVWEADTASGIWVTTARFGELSKEKGSTTATGSIGGFWTALWSPDGRSVVCLSRSGSWRQWDLDLKQESWVQKIAVTGHTKAVTGIAWSRDGQYLLSTSSDQTTRLHAEWRCEVNGNLHRTWHELSRPQIHGYDLNCIDTVGSSMFVSGADEKLMRVFNEPKSVARLVDRLTGIEEAGSTLDTLPDAADMPALGLSNKAVDIPDSSIEAAGATRETEEHADFGNARASRASALDFDHPPFEDSLSRLTLWPEVEKLYGHGYEISCLATSHDGKLIASACRATSLNHAVIRIFETERWTELKPPLAAHTLTATRLRFSADDRYLLSVGRDRQWAVFERKEDMVFVLKQANAKGHARMVLDAAWAPFKSSSAFVTAGRDKQVRLWASQTESEGEASTFALALTELFRDPVTAVDFHPRISSNNTALLAVGTEAGALEIFSVKLHNGYEVASLIKTKEM
jgi:elongator complex protein 2